MIVRFPSYSQYPLLWLNNSPDSKQSPDSGARRKSMGGQMIRDRGHHRERTKMLAQKQGNEEEGPGEPCPSHAL